jgi:hypothetical protein
MPNGEGNMAQSFSSLRELSRVVADSEVKLDRYKKVP